MQLADFLRHFQASGEILFDSNAPPELDAASEADAIQQLLEMDKRRRLELAHEAPRLRVDVAMWAARLMFRMSQFLVYREISTERIEADLGEPCPGDLGDEQTYSVDLTLWRLPELTQRAIQIASADPLVQQQLNLAWEWPLSSVGIALEVPVDGPQPNLAPVLGNPALLQLYVDRILAAKDKSRLHHPDVAAAIANAIGGYPNLAVDFAN
ncbi:MAG: hypothetical protein AAF585_28255 [Verrucomicrobiota bacterium]